ncbi:hypothetical protein KIL84_016418, partial [Mauremys mutica]
MGQTALSVASANALSRTRSSTVPGAQHERMDDTSEKRSKTAKLGMLKTPEPPAAACKRDQKTKSQSMDWMAGKNF